MNREHIELLKRHGIEYDERYLWGKTVWWLLNVIVVPVQSSLRDVTALALRFQGLKPLATVQPPLRGFARRYA